MEIIVIVAYIGGVVTGIALWEFWTNSLVARSPRKE